MVELATITNEDFEPYVGKTFTLTAGNGQCEVLLKDAQKSKYQNPHRQSFSLMFSAPVGINIEQGTYSLENNDLGKIDLFLVPVDMEEGATQLQAIFN